ncbi:RHS repeat-associated core domain-containing protein [Pseudomonas sp. NFX98]|uniref:RHS repeat-associated core domain-containing protein n=1 Tax=Pseudomonas sp. NFX98 TaxID=3399122 RepID=UPI0039FBF994
MMRKIMLCRYLYDPLDRLIGALPLTDAHTQHFYCKNRLATELQGTLKYSILRYDDQLLAQLQSSGETLDATLLAINQQNSVLRALHLRDPHSFAYSPYGHRNNANEQRSLLGFNGELEDRVTGYYLLGNGYRTFNPTLMRFNSPDIMSPFDKGGINPYAYCFGDPNNYQDPTGNFPIFRALKYNISWAISKSGTASKYAKATISNWDIASRKHWIGNLELRHTRKKLGKFNNSKAKKQFLLDYEKTLGSLNYEHDGKIALKTLDPNTPPEQQLKNVLNHIAQHDHRTLLVDDYDHQRLMLAARYPYDSRVKNLPEAANYLEKMNAIRGKKITNLDRKYLKLSKQYRDGSRDW